MPHDAIKRLGYFITRNRVVPTRRFVLRSLHFGIYTMHGEEGRQAQEELSSWLSQCDYSG